MPPSYNIVVNCVDGRVQIPVLEWMKRHLDGDLVHSITEPGPDAALAEGDRVGRIRPIVELLTENTRVAAVAVAAHHDCLGNPVDEAEHRAQVRRAAEEVASWGLVDRVLGLWVDGNWEVSVVCEA